MTRSLANGDYSLVMAIESASRPDSWYRVLADRQTGALSCDCPPWTFKQGQDAGAGCRGINRAFLSSYSFCRSTGPAYSPPRRPGAPVGRGPLGGGTQRPARGHTAAVARPARSLVD